jgi:hypothetical protein
MATAETPRSAARRRDLEALIALLDPQDLADAEYALGAILARQAERQERTEAA